MRPFWYCASVCCARRHLPPVYRLRPASRPLQPFRPFLPAKRRSRWSGSQRTAAKNITASLPAAIWKTRKRLHYRKQKRKASLLAKSAIKKIKNDLQSPCRKFSGRGSICVYKKLTKEITEKLQNPIAKWFQKSYNMVTARAQAQLSVKSFSSCFLGYRAQVLLLRLFSFTVVIHVPHRRYPASCAKKLVRSGRAFLHP